MDWFSGKLEIWMLDTAPCVVGFKPTVTHFQVSLAQAQEIMNAIDPATLREAMYSPYPCSMWPDLRAPVALEEPSRFAFLEEQIAATNALHAELVADRARDVIDLSGRTFSPDEIKDLSGFTLV